MFTFDVYDRVTGLPATGLAGSLSWHVYVNASTGAAAPQPGFVELGTSGTYETDADPTCAGLIDCGSGYLSTNGRYALVIPAGVLVIPAFDTTGAPKDDLTLSSSSWYSLYDAITGLPISPAYGFLNLTGGLYRINNVTNANAAGKVDLTTACLPRFYSIGIASESSGPVLSNPEPDQSMTISSVQALSFVLSDTGLTFADVDVEISVTFPSGATELVYGPSAGGFTRSYRGGSSAPTMLPGTFTISRGGGWSSDPTLNVFVVDTEGNSTSQSWSWSLASTVAISIPVVASPAAQPVYGSDMRTYLDLGYGQDWDPNMTIVTDPRIVMSENIARLLTMAPGGIFYAPNIGFDMRSLVNAKLTPGSIESIQQTIAQEVQRQQRIESAAVTLVPNQQNGDLAVTVQAAGAAGPFTCVFLVSSKSTTAVIQALSFQ